MGRTTDGTNFSLSTLGSTVYEPTNVCMSLERRSDARCWRSDAFWATSKLSSATRWAGLPLSICHPMPQPHQIEPCEVAHCPLLRTA